MTEQEKASDTEAPKTSAEDQNIQRDSAIEVFASQLNRLKELDLTGIEPLLPPTWKKGRYSNT